MHLTLRFCLIAVLLLAPASIAAAPNIRLTDDPGSSVRPRVALDPSGNAVVVWQDSRFGNDEILWQKFDQLGNPLSAVVRVTNTAGASRLPDVACDPTGVSHITWQEGENVLSVGTVYFCRLDAAGNKILSDVQIPVTNCGHPRVSALSDVSTDLVFFRSSGVIDFYTLYRRYSPTGAFVCSRQLGSSFTATVLSPTIATSSAGTASVFWLDIPTSSYIVRSTGVPTGCGSSSLSTIAGATSTTKTTVALGGPFVFRMFDAGGNILNVLGPNNVCQISQGSGHASSPSVGADANDGYVVWRDNRDGGNGEIYFARFWSCTNRSGDVRLTNDPAASVEPDIAVDPSGTGDWVAVWSDGRDGNREIYLTSQQLDAVPPAPGYLSASLLCPPAAQLTWQDLAGNETAYEIERSEDGGPWALAITLPAGSTSWTSGALEYGHSYEYRVRACNGSLCSAWAVAQSLPVAEQVLLREGIVRGTILERPYSDPTLRILPNARVSILREGNPVYSTYSNSETGAYQIVASMRCDDEIAVLLDDDIRRLAIVDWDEHQVSVCQQAAVPVMQQPIGSSTAIDFTWPVVSEGYSGDAVNVYYVYSRSVADYWEPRIGLTDTDWRDFFCRTDVPVVQDGMGVNSLGTAGKSCGSFQRGYGKYKSGILHELGHRMINQKLGLNIRQNLVPAQHPEAAEAAALDEGLADYFAAASTGDPRIHTRLVRFVGVEIATVLRDLSVLKLYPWCNGSYDARDEHQGGWALGGALWDLRGRLAAIPNFDPYELDRTVYNAISSLGGLDVEERTLRAFRAILLATQLGQDHSDDFNWAFDRHNIKSSPTDACRPSPEVASVTSTAEASGRNVTVSWNGVSEAAHYRLYVGRFAQSGVGVGPGELLADSVVATTYTYTEPDTTLTLAFRVSAVDALGDEGPVGTESPAVTGVSPSGRDGQVRFAIRMGPNPASGHTTIHLAGGHPGPVRIDVFDVTGRLVRSLTSEGERNVQARSIGWDGRADDGSHAAMGVYLIRARIADDEAWGRLVILR